MAQLLPHPVVRRLAELETRIQKAEDASKELMPGSRRRANGSPGKDGGEAGKLWHKAFQFAKADADELMEEANLNVKAADRLVLSSVRGERGTYLHDRAMRYFTKWMKESPSDFIRLLPESPAQRAEEINAIREWRFMGTLEPAWEIAGRQATREGQGGTSFEASILRGTLLWPGPQVSSCQAARWSQDLREYSFQHRGTLWKHLVDEYLVHATPSLGSWVIRRGGQSIFVKLTPAALQACPAAMRSLEKIGITMENYLERYHGERLGVVQSDPSEKVHESHVLRSRGGYVWCQQCGAYYSVLPLRGRLSAKLKRECHVASTDGRGHLKRIRLGLPPDKRIRQGLPPDRLASKLAKRLGTLSHGHALAPSPA